MKGDFTRRFLSKKILMPYFMRPTTKAASCFFVSPHTFHTTCCCDKTGGSIPMSKAVLPPPPPPPPEKKKNATKNSKGSNNQVAHLSSTRRPTHLFSRLKPSEPFGVVGFLFVTVLCFFWFLFYAGRCVLPAPVKVEAWVGGKSVGGVLGSGSVAEGGERCDLFDGKWVWDEGYPLYDARECRFLDEGFRCSENGRPDVNYTKWRWQPNHCMLPRFDARDMLKRLQNKRLVFVGDSIGRNQWESLLCMLSSAVADKSSIYEVNGNPITKHNGFLVFKFRDYNCTIEYYRSPFLVPQSRPPKGMPSKVLTTLKLDIMDWTSSRWRDADILIFNTGHWWNHEKTIRSGCYFQEGADVKMEMSVESAYSRSINTLTNWVRREVNTSKTYVIYRTYSPAHFRGGDWKTGGNCHLETLPELDASKPKSRPWVLKVVDDVIAESTTSDIDVLNITQLTQERRDGHSSRYYLGPGKLASLYRQDCSHWCLPGVPDTWNELLYALFLRRHSPVSNRHSSIAQATKKKALPRQKVLYISLV